jgi:transcriptional regulator with XRE-family HTH domain
LALYRFSPEAAKQARIDAGFKIAHIALAFDRVSETVRSWELGRVEPSPAVIYGMADLYGVDPAELLVAVEQEGLDPATRLRIESRRAMGLPDQVEDPVALDEAAELLKQERLVEPGKAASQATEASHSKAPTSTDLHHPKVHDITVPDNQPGLNIVTTPP